MSAVFGDQVVDLLLQLAFGPALRIKHCDGMTALMAYHLHRRNVGISITEIDDPRKRNGTLLGWDPAVDRVVIPRVVYLLVDPEQELRLVRVVDRDGRP